MRQENALKRATLPSVLLLGTALTLSGCGRDAGDAPMADWDNVAKLPSIPQLTSTNDALARIESGELSHNVLETASPKGETFSYVFVRNKDEKPLILRGVVHGPDRENFLRALTQLKATPQGKIANEISSVELAPEVRPWYSEISLFVLKWGVGGAIALYLMKRGSQLLASAFGKAAEAMQDRESEEESKKPFNEKKKGKLENPAETLDDVGGSFAAVDRLRIIVDDIRKYKAGEWADLPRGVLFSGDEGTGKTHSARALAGEIGGGFIETTASQLTSSPYIGAWGSKVSKLFERARAARDEMTKSLRKKRGATGKEQGVIILFIDEFDSLGSSRKRSGSHDEQNRAVNAALAEMDHIDRDRNRGIILIGATNLKGAIDPALLRPGRFREQVEFTIPTSAYEREDVLQKAGKRILKDSELKGFTKDLRMQLAAITVGFSQDRLRAVVAEAARAVKRSEETTITLNSLIEALLVVTAGPRSDREAPPRRQELTMAHEHGHGFISQCLGYPPVVVSALPRGSTLGLVLSPANSLLEGGANRDDILSSMLLLAGGRAGELVYGGLGATSSGVSEDFARLQQLARVFIKSGMTDGVSLQGDPTNHDDDSHELDRQVDDLASKAVRVAKEILETLGQENFKAMVSETIHEKMELIGPAVKRFYDEYHKAKADSIAQVLKRFMEDPLGQDMEKRHH